MARRRLTIVDLTALTLSHYSYFTVRSFHVSDNRLLIRLGSARIGGTLPGCTMVFYVNLLIKLDRARIGGTPPLCTDILYVNLLIGLGSARIGGTPLLCTLLRASPAWRMLTVVVSITIFSVAVTIPEASSGRFIHSTWRNLSSLG
jgi:hypothetical protein